MQKNRRLAVALAAFAVLPVRICSAQLVQPTALPTPSLANTSPEALISFGATIDPSQLEPGAPEQSLPGLCGCKCLKDRDEETGGQRLFATLAAAKASSADQEKKYVFDNVSIALPADCSALEDKKNKASACSGYLAPGDVEKAQAGLYSCGWSPIKIPRISFPVIR